jgi:hypothetical protein
VFRLRHPNASRAYGVPGVRIVTFLGTWFAPIVILVLFVGLPLATPRLWQATKNAACKCRVGLRGNGSTPARLPRSLSPYELIGMGGCVRWK